MIASSVFSLEIALLNGERKLLHNLCLDDSVWSLHERVGLELGCPGDEIKLFSDGGPVLHSGPDVTLKDIRLHEVGTVTCLIETTEQTLIPQALCMSGCKWNEDLGTRVFESYLNDYRLRRMRPVVQVASGCDEWTEVNQLKQCSIDVYEGRRCTVDAASGGVRDSATRIMRLLSSTTPALDSLEPARQLESQPTCHLGSPRLPCLIEKDIRNMEALVVDVGSLSWYAGYAGDDSPSCVGWHAAGPDCADITKPPFVPIMYGVVVDWEAMEQVWHRMFYNDLQVDPANRPILLSEAILNPRTNRETMVSIMFESFGVIAVHVELALVLALYSSGRTTGIALSCGDSVTQVLPIWEGFAIPHAAARQNLAGRNVTEKLLSSIVEENKEIVDKIDFAVVRNIKESLCYVALDFEKSETDQPKLEEYRLADTVVITFGRELYRSPEILFQPRFAGLPLLGCHELVFQSIWSCDIDTRRDLSANVIVCGGTTLLPGFIDRFRTELRALVPCSLNVKVPNMPERLHSVWIGGSILGSLQCFTGLWVSKSQYDEGEWGMKLFCRHL